MQQQAIDQIVAASRAAATALIWEACHSAEGDWTQGVIQGVPGLGLPIRLWTEGLSASGQAARAGMFGYIGVAERFFEVERGELATGEAPSDEATTERDAAAGELASYEEAHPAPAGVIPARAR